MLRSPGEILRVSSFNGEPVRIIPQPKTGKPPQQANSPQPPATGHSPRNRPAFASGLFFRPPQQGLPNFSGGP
ncbi:MAG: hypothetical protein WC058_03935 [Phycisphaeraceae bacterium]